MVSPFLSGGIVLLSRLKMCILSGSSTGPSLSIPQWNSVNESLFQVLQRVLRFNFRVQLPFFLELIINWHCCCLNSLRFSQRQVVASSTIDPVSTSDNQKNKIKKVFFYIFWSEPTVSGKRLADSLSSAVELHEPWKTSEFSRTSRIKSNKNTDSTTYKHEYIKSWLIKKLTPWSILHFSLRSNLKQFRQAHIQIHYWWNHLECCKLLAQYQGCVLVDSFTFLLLLLWLLATKYTKYIGEKKKQTNKQEIKFQPKQMPRLASYWLRVCSLKKNWSKTCVVHYFAMSQKWLFYHFRKLRQSQLKPWRSILRF